MERWKFAFEPDLFEEPPEVTDFPFVDPKATPEEIAASLKPDRRGMLRADVHGMPTRNEETGEPNRVDIDGVPIEPDDTEIGAVLRVLALSAVGGRRGDAAGRRAEPADPRQDGRQLRPGQRRRLSRPTAATWRSTCSRT